MSKSMMSFSKHSLVAAALLVGMVGCARDRKPDPMDSVSGVIVKPDHMRLRPGAVVHVRLADVTKGHVKSETIAQRTMRVGDDGTIPFTMSFKDSEIDKGRKYAVDARIVDCEHLYVIGGKEYPVLTKGHGDTVEMELDWENQF